MPKKPFSRQQAGSPCYHLLIGGLRVKVFERPSGCLEYAGHFPGGSDDLCLEYNQAKDPCDAKRKRLNFQDKLYQQNYGKLPAGTTAIPICNNLRCLNHRHLKPLTAAQQTAFSTSLTPAAWLAHHFKVDPQGAPLRPSPKEVERARAGKIPLKAGSLIFDLQGKRFVLIRDERTDCMEQEGWLDDKGVVNRPLDLISKTRNGKREVSTIAREACLSLRGPFLKDKTVIRICGNNNCINPLHLVPVDTSHQFRVQRAENPTAFVSHMFGIDLKGRPLSSAVQQRIALAEDDRQRALVPPGCQVVKTEYFKVIVKDAPSGCKEFVGTLRRYEAMNTSYPQAFSTFDDKAHSVPNDIYKITKGAIYGSRRVIHVCGNDRCLNPEHLVAMTDSERMKFFGAVDRGTFAKNQLGIILSRPEEEVLSLPGDATIREIGNARHAFRTTGDGCLEHLGIYLKGTIIPPPKNYDVMSQGKKCQIIKALYLLEKGKVPSGWVVLPLCGNPDCVSPHHSAATTREMSVRISATSGLGIPEMLQQFRNAGCSHVPEIPEGLTPRLRPREGFENQSPDTRVIETEQHLLLARDLPNGCVEYLNRLSPNGQLCAPIRRIHTRQGQTVPIPLVLWRKKHHGTPVGTTVMFPLCRQSLCLNPDHWVPMTLNQHMRYSQSRDKAAWLRQNLGVSIIDPLESEPVAKEKDATLTKASGDSSVVQQSPPPLSIAWDPDRQLYVATLGSLLSGAGATWAAAVAALEDQIAIIKGLKQ